jgi:hypothetical protein
MRLRLVITGGIASLIPVDDGLGKAEAFRTSGGESRQPVHAAPYEEALANRNQCRFAVGMSQGQIEFRRYVT